MGTILEQLRRLQMEEAASPGKEEKDEGTKEVKLNGVYRCRACGYIFDEALEGKPFSTLEECPLCHVSPSGFMKLR